MDTKSQPCRDDLKMERKRWVMKEVMWGCWCSIDKGRGVFNGRGFECGLSLCCSGQCNGSNRIECEVQSGE